MAATVTSPTSPKVQRQTPGSYFMVTRHVVMGASYPTGGEPITAAQFGLKALKQVGAVQFNSGFSAAFAFIDPIVQADGSLLVRLRAAAGTEVPNATDASTVVCRITVLGIGG